MHLPSSQNHPKISEKVQQRSSHLRHLKRVESVENLPYQSPISLTGAMDLLKRQTWAAVVRAGKTTHCNSFEADLEQQGWRDPSDDAADGKKQEGNPPIETGSVEAIANDCLLRPGLHLEPSVTRIQFSAIRPRENFSLLEKHWESLIYEKRCLFLKG